MEYLQVRYGIYIQAMNYPTVPRGREKLRLVPTPFHTEEMMDELIKAFQMRHGEMQICHSQNQFAMKTFLVNCNPLQKILWGGFYQIYQYCDFQIILFYMFLCINKIKIATSIFFVLNLKDGLIHVFCSYWSECVYGLLI